MIPVLSMRGATGPAVVSSFWQWIPLLLLPGYLPPRLSQRPKESSAKGWETYLPAAGLGGKRGQACTNIAAATLDRIGFLPVLCRPCAQWLLRLRLEHCCSRGYAASLAVHICGICQLTSPSSSFRPCRAAAAPCTEDQPPPVPQLYRHGPGCSGWGSVSGSPGYPLT